MLKLLYLYNKDSFKTRHSQSRIHYIEAIGRFTQLQTWGIGDDDFINDKNLAKRIKKKFGKLDYIFVYKPFEFNGIKKVKTPLVMEYNEMLNRPEREEIAYQELRTFQPKIVFGRLKNEMIDARELFPKTTFIYNPHGANERIFQDYGLEKKIDVGLIGDLKPHIYPHRVRLHKIIDRLKAEGYNAQYQFFAKEREDKVDDHLIELAKFINRCKVCITCSSIMRERIAKLVEIPMCKTVLGCDTPYNLEEDMCQSRLRLETSMTDEEIISEIKNLLANEDRLKQMSEESCEWAQSYTLDKYAQKVVAELEKQAK